MVMFAGKVQKQFDARKPQRSSGEVETERENMRKLSAAD